MPRTSLLHVKRRTRQPTYVSFGREKPGRPHIARERRTNHSVNTGYEVHRGVPVPDLGRAIRRRCSDVVLASECCGGGGCGEVQRTCRSRRSVVSAVRRSSAPSTSAFDVATSRPAFVPTFHLPTRTVDYESYVRRRVPRATDPVVWDGRCGKRTPTYRGIECRTNNI